MDKKNALETLIKSCHHLVINMNDTFHYASGDSSNLDSDDALDLLPFIDQYGFDALKAYEAIKRGYDPQIEQVVTPKFLEIKNILLEKMNQDENFLCSLNYDKREEEKQIKEFGGILKFKFVNPSWLAKLKGQRYMTCICTCAGRTEKGFGSNMNEAKLDLKKE